MAQPNRLDNTKMRPGVKTPEEVSALPVPGPSAPKAPKARVKRKPTSQEKRIVAKRRQPGAPTPVARPGGTGPFGRPTGGKNVFGSPQGRTVRVTF